MIRLVRTGSATAIHPDWYIVYIKLLKLCESFVSMKCFVLESRQLLVSKMEKRQLDLSQMQENGETNNAGIMNIIYV